MLKFLSWKGNLNLQSIYLYFQKTAYMFRNIYINATSGLLFLINK
uniref:Uncharacterized protein n=1 Tax=Anguilla anguilla TaxID=7936 RepID=A0A0E9WJG1_ANGAN